MYINIWKAFRIIRESGMQINILLRAHLTPVRMASIKKQQMLQWMQKIIIHYQQEYKLVQPLWELLWKFLEKLKIEVPYGPALPLLGLYPKGSKSANCRDTCTSIAALFTIACKLSQPRVQQQIHGKWPSKRVALIGGMVFLGEVCHPGGGLSGLLLNLPSA